MANGAVPQTKESLVVPQINGGNLSFLTKLSYGFGEFSASVVWSLASSYLLFFIQMYSGSLAEQQLLFYL